MVESTKKRSLAGMLKGGTGGAKRTSQADAEETSTAVTQRQSPDTQKLLDKIAGLPSNDAPALLRISVDLIDENPLPQRHIYPEEETLAIAQTLKDNGQRDAIHVRPNPDAPGRFIICDGWTRTLSVKRHGAELGLPRELDAKIDEGLDDIGGAILGYLQNEERNPHSDVDKGLFFASLVNGKGMMQKDVMAFAKIKHASDMSAYMTFSRLAPEVISTIALDKHGFTRSYVADVAAIQERHGIPAAVAVTEGILGRDPDGNEVPRLTLADIRRRLEELDKLAALGAGYKKDAASGSAPVTAAPEKVTLRISKNCVLTHDAGQIKTTLKVKKLPAQEREALLEELKGVLSKYFA